MKKLFLSLICFGLLAGFGAYAKDEVADFDDGVEIKPLSKELSAQEAKNSTLLEDVDYGQQLPDLSCSDAGLKKQIANFLYSYVNKDGASSVIEQRAQLLLVRNLHEFVAEDEKKLDPKNNYAAAAVVAYLKINQNKEIHKICRSLGNDSKKFADLFAVIYRDGAYYQVVIPNMLISTKDIDKATFTYNW